MRIINDLALRTMESPIRYVLKDVHLALINVAPEREEEFDRIWGDFELKYVDDQSVRCCVYLDDKLVELYRGMPESLWSCAINYWRLYSHLQSCVTGTELEPFRLDLMSVPRLPESLPLLSRALQMAHRETVSAWPENTPFPLPNPTFGSDEHVADELTRCALGVILHHELAHIRFNHNGSRDSVIECERDADYAAADWILDKVPDQDDPYFKKRILGIVVAMTALVANSVHTGNYDGITHPRTFDRLMNVLDRHIDDPNHVAWWFALSALTLHLDNAAHIQGVPKGPFSSARNALDAAVEKLSRYA